MRTLLVLFFLPAQLIAQDISGIWTGSIQTQGNKLTYELVISGSSENLDGYALTVFTIERKENVGIKTVNLKNKKGNVSLEDDELVYDNYTTSPRRMKLFARLSLNTTSNTMTLSGNFHTRSLDFRSNGVSYTGFIVLQKQKNDSKTRLMAELDSMSLLDKLSFLNPPSTQPTRPVTTKTEKKNEKVKEPPIVKEEIKKPVTKLKEKPDDVRKIPDEKTVVAENPKVEAVDKPVPPIAASEIAERKTQIIRNVFFNADSIKLTLYDNGTVDGDTVSVLLNGKLILARKGLSTTAIRAVASTTAEMGDSLMLVMYAENLGSIPPNTGLLIIEEGSNRYEIRFEGDLQKSSAIILRRRK